MNYSEATSRCWLEVDLNAIRENYRSANRILKGKLFAIPVLKANAYGMGAVDVARVLHEEGAELFAVAASAEAEQIIRAVPGVRVLSMGLCEQAAAERLIKADQPLTAYSLKSIRMLSDTAARLGKKACIHIKIDTGLHRLGFDPETAVQEILPVCAEGHLTIEGLFTHLAIHTAEMDRIQMEKLDTVRVELEQAGISVPVVHAMDSIGMVRYTQICRNLNAVRIGAWLYGVEPRGNTAEHCLFPARFCSRVSQLRCVRCGELIGYDDDHPLTRDSRLATVTAGYIDGTPRVGNGWAVEIRGMRAPVIGIACMDQLVCDVTDIPGVEEGDIVTFCGGGINVEEYSRMGAFNHNEAWARIGRRVPRVYMENGRFSHVGSELEA